MKSPLKIPPFRIEIRDESNPDLWWPMEFAHSETHRNAKLAMRQAEFGADNARYVDNTPHQPPAQAVTARASKPGARSRDDDATVTPPAAAAIEASQPAAVPDSAPAAAPIPALPFREGDEIEDEHSGARVRVDKIHADGFDWINLDPSAAENAKTGTCPHASAEYFSPVKKAKAAAEKTSAPRSTPAKSGTPRAKSPRAHKAKTSHAAPAEKTSPPKAAKAARHRSKKKS